MSVVKQIILSAEYNQLMNMRQFSAAANLSREELAADRGAFFKSILGALNHILVGDIIWLKRFADHPSSSKALSYMSEIEKPSSLNSIIFTDLDAMKEQRGIIDKIIVNWVSGLDESVLNDCISYTNMSGSLFKKPFISLINHLFLHQVHHRGQVTTLLSQYGIDFGETDLIEIIDECSA